MSDGVDDDLDLMAVVTALWRGKWTIVLFALVAFAIAGYYISQVATSRYQSTAELTINLRGNEVSDIQSVVSGVSTDWRSLHTELEIIRSRNLLGRVVDRLELTEDPEFNSSLRTPSAFELKKQEFKARIRELVNAVVQMVIPSGSNESETSQSPSDMPDPGPQQSAAREPIIGMLRGMVSTAITEDTYVFRINVTTSSPEKSKLIANTLAEVYIEDQIAVKFKATEQAVTWLSDRVATLEQELVEKENVLKAAMSETDMINPEALAGLNRQAKDLRDRLEETRSQVSRIEDRISRITKLRAADDFAGLVSMTEDPTLNRLFSAIRNNTPDAIQMFDQRLDSILNRDRSELQRQRSQIELLKSSLEQIETQIQRQSEDLGRIQQLSREVEATKTLYETLLTRLKETDVRSGLQQADSRVLSDARSGWKVAPRSSRITLASVILGALLGAGVVLLRHFLHNAFRTPEELEDATGLPVMGQIPKMPIKARKNLIPYLSDKPTSPAAEAIRNLRTSILLSNIDSPPQVIMTTSSVPGEGKTTAAIALTKNFSDLGKKVLLIEGDIRRRSLKEYFKINQKYGLISVLSNEVPFEQVIFHDIGVGADVLLSEGSRVNAVDLFSSERFGNFMKTMREIYDVIVIDTPPVLVVADARVIGQCVDATIFVVAWDSTSRNQVTAALRDLASINLNVAGLALTQIDPKGMRKYGYGQNSGYYSSYGKGYYEA